MKTAVSIPDAIFQEADELAQRRGVSRSQLYATALERYLESERSADVTETLNRLLENEPPEPDPFITRAAALTFKRTEW
jgi:metal-responsive CopG/Arc/MetJ family transcriptional regulator